ncbi:Transposase [Halomicrobium sp. LC1Hm]|nr:Transposase [Halomicrobium sp. LC1Hm]
MPENGRLIGNLDEIDLEFVEREATPRLLMKFSFSCISLDYHFRILFLFLRYLVSKVLDPLFIIGFTRPSYSQNLADLRITLWSTRR